MAALSVKPLIDQLHGAGLNLSLRPGGGLSVAPASRLNDDLRVLIRANKNDLVAWLTAPNDPEPPLDRAQWLELDREYQRHHWTCATCCAAGQGYGPRCGVGAALWSTQQGSRCHE